MGEPGTHPWAQGFPLTTQLPGGPALPTGVDVSAVDLKYPAATGEVQLRQAIAGMYNEHYGARLHEDNVALFAGGRPAILATLALLLPDMTVAVEETEYTPYYDMLRLLGRAPRLVASNEATASGPGTPTTRRRSARRARTRSCSRAIPATPRASPRAGTTCGGWWSSSAAREAARSSTRPTSSSTIPRPTAPCATWTTSTRPTCSWWARRRRAFRRRASASAGPSPPGVTSSCSATSRRSRWGACHASPSSMPCACSSPTACARRGRPCRPSSTVNGRATRKASRSSGSRFTPAGRLLPLGEAARVPTAAELNERLFAHGAAILPGRLCDMARRSGQPSPLDRFMRFSFGPL